MFYCPFERPIEVLWIWLYEFSVSLYAVASV